MICRALFFRSENTHGNIIDYVRNELRTFGRAFNDVDSLVLSQFAYLDLSDQVGDPSKTCRPYDWRFISSGVLFDVY